MIDPVKLLLENKPDKPTGYTVNYDGLPYIYDEMWPNEKVYITGTPYRRMWRFHSVLVRCPIDVIADPELIPNVKVEGEFFFRLASHRQVIDAFMSLLQRWTERYQDQPQDQKRLVCIGFNCPKNLDLTDGLWDAGYRPKQDVEEEMEKVWWDSEE